MPPTKKKSAKRDRYIKLSISVPEALINRAVKLRKRPRVRFNRSDYFTTLIGADIERAEAEAEEAKS